MQLRPHSIRLVRRQCRTRLPFRFGIATMTEAPMLFAAVHVDTDAGPAVGHGAELLVPKWFAKTPDTSHDDDRADLARAAIAAFKTMHGEERSPFAHWLNAQRELVEGAHIKEPLVAAFGVSLVERCLIDAICRATGQSFSAALRDDHFGLRPGEVDPRLDSWSADSLHAPLGRTAVRHTVGLVDDLDDGDLGPEADRSDHHPLTLAEDIRAYGLTWFKLKVSGQRDADLHRLERIAALLPTGARVTLDGNEQYGDPGALAEVLDDLERRGAAGVLLEGLVSIEQPVSRTTTFEPSTRDGIARLGERAPVIIDEADATLDAYPRARALGYRGVSMKACKGVFRAVVNRARIDADGDGIQSAEDLTNLPHLPLCQDLAVVGALGLTHVERNGHHYFRGGAHLSPAERSHLAERHGGLLRGGTDLRIEGGMIELDSVNDAKGLGYAGPVGAPGIEEPLRTPR